MRNETKEMLYTVLDLLDSLSKTSRNSPEFISIDNNILNNIKKDIFSIISEPSIYKKIDRKTELIGVLPSVLIDRNKFPANEDIVKLANNSLNLEISRWEKKSRDELIGIIISKIALKDDSDLEKFLKAWKDFIKDDKSRNYKVQNKDFVTIWLDFFDHYKGEK